MDIEATFKKVGYWGFYQKRLCVLLVISTIPNGILVMLPVFTHETPSHRCFIPDIDNATAGQATEFNHSYANHTSEHLLSLYIPMENTNSGKELSKCKMFVNPTTQLERITGNSTTTLPEDNVTSCQYGWVYDLEPGRETVVTNWNIVCDQAWIKPVMTSTQMIGVVVSSFATGYVSDRYGRQPAFFWSTCLQGLFTLLAGFSTNIPMYSIFLTISGGFSFTNFVAAVVIASEMLSPKMRSVSVNLQMVGFAIGYMVLPLTAYGISKWRNMYIIMGASAIFVIPYWWWLLESPRWLIQRNRPEDARKIMTRIAKVNGRWTAELEQSLEESALLETSDEKKDDDINIRNVQYTYLDLFRHAAIRRRLLILGYSWIIFTMTYYFFSYNTGNLGGNAYVNCLLSGMVEIPSALLSMVMMGLIGRCVSYIALMMLGAILCAITPFILDASVAAGVATAMFGKLILTAAFDLAYLYTPEVFPTLLRYKALAITSFLGRIGGILAPYLVYWGENTNRYMPYLFMGALTALSAILALVLPETKNLPLPDTLEDARKMKNILEYYGHRRKGSNKDENERAY